MSLGIDVGGTFTDVVSWDGTRLALAKTSSTPADQSVGVVDGCAMIDGEAAAPLLVHGTTVATNALLERDGCQVMLVTGSGFEDVIEIGRQARPSLYDPAVDRSAPLVARDRRVGVVDADVGDVEVPDDVQAVTVGFLGAFADGLPERSAAAELRHENPRVQVVASSEISGEFREFERINTALLSAYLGPKVEAYLDRLTTRVVPEHADRVLVMRSNGGLVPPRDAARNAASILLSGPAGGVVAAAEVGRALGHNRVISFDMGGTSTDVCRIENGVPEIGFERTIDGQVCRMPSIAVHTVGAGGGSIGWIDPGGVLRVGPRSAGADPGPASYGRGGTEMTVTDANLVAGRLGAGALLAGSVPLDADAAEAAARRLGAQIGLDVEQVALGVIQVVDAHMERAIRTVSVEEGADPRAAALVAFGGAGGLHAVPLAQSLSMRSVIVPPAAGVFSALGLLLSRPRWDRARSVLLGEDRAGELDDLLQELVDQTVGEYRSAIGASVSDVVPQVDVRYLGQSHETTVRLLPGEGWDTLAERFHHAHHERNGFARPGTPIEAVTLRVAVTGEPQLRWDEMPEVRPTAERSTGRRSVLTADGPTDALVLRRESLGSGDAIAGPAVIEETEATAWIPPGCSADVHPSGAIEVTW